MKKLFLMMLALCLLLAGCGNSAEDVGAAAPESVSSAVEAEQNAAADAKQEAPAVTVLPLAEDIMANLDDAMLAVSLEKGGVYVDDTGKMQMDVKIYNYDKYDMVDISNLKVGDIITTHAGDVEVTSMDRNAAGTLYINGGLEEGGFDLVTDDSGIFFETGYNDVKNWYEVGKATLRVSTEFVGYDNADPDQGEVLFYPGSFVNDEIANYNFYPHNTTIRVEGGQVVELHRMYTP